MTIPGMSSSAGMPQVMAGANSCRSPSQKMLELFRKIDIGGSGSITKAQLKQVFQNTNPPSAFKAMGANAIFNKLDSNAPAGPSMHYTIFLFGAMVVFQP